MSNEKDNSNLLEEVEIFTDFALEQARRDVQNGDLPNVALLIHGGPEVKTDEPVGGKAMVRILDQEGRLVSEAELDEGQSPDDFVKGIVGEDFKAKNEAGANLVAVIPFTPPTPVWSMTIGAGSKIVNAKFLTVVMETWVGSEGWKKAPSKDPNRKEALVAFSPYFDGDDLAGIYTVMIHFKRDKDNNITFEEPIKQTHEGPDQGSSAFGGNMIRDILAARGTNF